MKSKKLITGIAVGAVIALLLVPKTRKMISEALCTLTGSLKDAMNKAEDVVAEA